MGLIAVLGSTGMLGSAVASTNFDGYEIVEVNRTGKTVFEGNLNFRVDSNLSNFEDLLKSHSIDYVINCAGLIRHKIIASDFKSIDAAVTANIGIPLELVRLSEKYNFKILQIGTDCVFSGMRGKYLEQDSHDAQDLYGRTKSIGEVPHQNVALIRSSIVGLEENSNLSLMSWLLSQTENAIVNGYSDQLWNGVTVLHFAKLVMGIVSSNNFDIFSGVHHFIPSDFASKGEMLELFTKCFNRKDIGINHIPSGNGIDMRLGTSDTEFNKFLWRTAGYEAPKSIEEMVVEYSLASKRWRLVRSDK